jgi:hypothetical protein
MLELDYTKQGRRPSAKQIVSEWRKAGKPDDFEVTYGETYARFTLWGMRWQDTGNGCRGVDRTAVVKLLSETKEK